MADFVPMQGAGGFQARLMGGVQGPPANRGVDATAGESGAPAEPESPLPTSVEELEALLEEVRQGAREDAGLVLAEDRAALKREREQLMRLVENVEGSRAAWGEEVRNVLGELVVVGVRQVVGESADLQEAMLRDRFAEVGERLIGETEVVVRVRPEDEASANALLGGRDGWTVVPDADISGGIVAETEGGKVDATMGAAVSGLNDAVQTWQSEGVGEE